MIAPDTRLLYHSEDGYRAMMTWYETEFERLSRDVALETRFVETRFGLTHIVFAGDESAPPLVMIQGLGGNAMMLHPQFREFAPRFRLVVPDVPGQPGKSAPTRIPHNGAHFALWLREVLDRLELPQVDILGVSQGGRIVLKFGACYAERIRKAVLISCMGLSGLRLELALRAIAIALGSVRTQGDAFQSMVNILMTRPIEHADSDLARLTKEFYLFFKHFRQELITGVPTAFPLPKGELERFSPRTMLLLGEKETLFDPNHTIRKAGKYLPNLEKVALIPEAGHIMHYEHSEIINQRVLDYLCKSGEDHRSCL